MFNYYFSSKFIKLATHKTRRRASTSTDWHFIFVAMLS